MTALSSWRVVPMALVLVPILGLGRPAGAAPELQVAVLLDQYAAGRFDEAVAAVAGATREQARSLRNQLWLHGLRWVSRDPADRSRRLLAAASFALESEVSRAERGDWPMFMYGQGDCAGRCVLEWARSMLLLRGAPDEAERTWWLASVALLEGVRDWRFLSTPASSFLFDNVQGHVAHAFERFPGDPRFRMAQVFAVASRFLVVTAAAPRGPLPSSDQFVVTVFTIGPRTTMSPVGSTQLRQQVSIRERVTTELADLASDPVVGPEARVRLGYLHWTGGGNDTAARTELRAAADFAVTDPDVRYLARFILGMIAQASGAADTARAEFEAALEARPRSQSAVLALAALEFQQGGVDSAYDLARDSLSHRTGSDDPWRQFLYGGFRTLPAQIARLRQQVRR